MNTFCLKSGPWLPFDPGMLLTSRSDEMLQFGCIYHARICLVQVCDSSQFHCAFEFILKDYIVGQ